MVLRIDAIHTSTVFTSSVICNGNVIQGKFVLKPDTTTVCCSHVVFNGACSVVRRYGESAVGVDAAAARVVGFILTNSAIVIENDT